MVLEIRQDFGKIISTTCVRVYISLFTRTPPWTAWLVLTLLFPAIVTAEVQRLTARSADTSLSQRKAQSTTFSVVKPSYESAREPRSGAVPEATWVADPTVPGEDLPPAGRSIFDTLFTVERDGKSAYEIPFPFTELIKNIDAHLPRGTAGRSSVKQVLIPLGRSLQRHAADPDYFKYPRVVVAVDTEPGSSTAAFLKDRLFLGYQERANIIEVISYNEVAGRFEFQIVRDYGPGLNPQVLYARRALCTSCHQNGAPIFAESAWDETNSNPKIATRLWDEQRDYYGIPVNRMTDVPFAIDSATDRANLFSVYQLLWRQGCGGDTATSSACRAAAFTAMLQYRLSGRTGFDTRSSQYRNQFVSVSERNWRTRWPGGLKIPNPDIPNRDPLTANGRISARVDPLALRPPLDIWTDYRQSDVERVITGLSEFMTIADIRSLDDYLFNSGRQPDSPKRQFNSTCELTRKRLSDSASRVSFICRARAEANVGGFGMRGRFYIDAGKVTRGVIDSLRLNDKVLLRDIELPGGAIELDGEQWRTKSSLHQRRTGLHARLPNGNALEHAEFRWSDPDLLGDRSDPIPSEDVLRGVAVLSVLEDFAPVHRAITELAERQDKGIFSARPFRGERALEALFIQLGTASGKPCCEEAVAMPRAIVDGEDLAPTAIGSSAGTHIDAMRTFDQYCATCHRTKADFPPNFLYGNTKQVTANLEQCAARIWYRLGMWQLAKGQRPKTPMPPVNMLRGANVSVERWRHGAELTVLQRYVKDILGHSKATLPTQLLHGRKYETLPECLSK